MTFGISIKSHYAECRYANSLILFIFVQNVIMLNVIMLSVVTLNVATLSVVVPFNEMSISHPV